MCGRKAGHNRSMAENLFNDQLSLHDHSPDLQRALTSASNTYSPPCWKRGMCVAHANFGDFSTLHNQVLKEVIESLKKSYGDKGYKDVLISGDTLIQVRWKVPVPGRVQADRMQHHHQTTKYFLIATHLCLCSTWVAECSRYM